MLMDIFFLNLNSAYWNKYRFRFRVQEQLELSCGATVKIQHLVGSCYICSKKLYRNLIARRIFSVWQIGKGNFFLFVFCLQKWLTSALFDTNEFTRPVSASNLVKHCQTVYRPGG